MSRAVDAAFLAFLATGIVLLWSFIAFGAIYLAGFDPLHIRQAPAEHCATSPAPVQS